MSQIALLGHYNTTKTCFSLPPKINSNGISWEKSPLDFLNYSLPLFELQAAVILMITHGLCFLLHRFGITAFICQVLAGIILSPTFLGRLNFMQKVIFPKDSQETISVFALFGYVTFVFVKAVKLDTESTLRSTGKLATVTAVVSVLVPIGLGFGFFKSSYGYLKNINEVKGVFTVIVLNSFSSFTMIVHVIEELKLPNSELSMLVRSTSLVAAGVGILIAVAITISVSHKNALIDLAAYFAYFLVARLLFNPVMLWMIRKTPQGLPMNKSFTFLVMIAALMSETYFRIIHQLPGLGAYTFGILVPAGPPLGSAIADIFKIFWKPIFMPISVVTAVMRTDLFLIIHEYEKIKLYLAIIAVISITKCIATLVPSLYMEMPLIDSVLFSLLMNSRGNIELALYTYARDTALVTEPVFALLILNMLISTGIIDMYAKRLYDPTRKYAGYQARNIMSLKPKSELRILTCVHKPENISSITTMVDAFHPSKERSIALCVLHLIKLVGRHNPVVMSHQKQKPVTDSSSHNMIISFGQYEQSNWGKVSISAFTAISPSRIMNEDISLLALDQLASLILLPFHRKWSIHGTIEAEDNTLRNINRKVLEKSPCSVGIFFDRGKLGRRNTSSLSICVVFLGGKDDREALSLAKRIARDSTVHLTVIHFVTYKIEFETDDRDTCILEDIKQPSEHRDAALTNIEYNEQVVNAGVDTAKTIRSIADEFDLFLVGRRYGIESPQTSGLSEWTDIPELGVIGDMLASNDTNTRAAVLVVQQQRKYK